VEEGVPAAGGPQKGAITPPSNPSEGMKETGGAPVGAPPVGKRILTIRQKIDNYRLIFISSESIASVTVTTFALAW